MGADVRARVQAQPRNSRCCPAPRPGTTNQRRQRPTGSRRISRVGPARRPARPPGRLRSTPGDGAAGGPASRSPAAGTRTAGLSPWPGRCLRQAQAGPPIAPAALLASPGPRISRLMTMVSSSAASRRRLVISTRLPAVPGSSGRTCSCPAASSRTSSTFLPAKQSRQRAKPGLPTPGGICRASIPAASSKLDSASAGSTGRCPGVCACNGKNNCPSGKLGANWCAACTAKRGLADPRHPADRMDSHQAAGLRVGERCHQRLKLGSTGR